MYMCGCFVIGVSMYRLAVVEALWRPTGIKFVIIHKTWEPGVEACESCLGLAVRKFPGYQTTSYKYARLTMLI